MYRLDTIRVKAQDGKGKKWYNPTRKKESTAKSTKAQTEALEDAMAYSLFSNYGAKINHRYDVPYIDSLEIKVPTVGRVSSNALDSIAKYSYLAGIPLYEGLGLSAQETGFGAVPAFNLTNDTAYLKQYPNYNRALANSSYFRNYGEIPAAFLVRDWAYYNLPESKRDTVPPLLHAFDYWKRGKYNTGDKKHTGMVRERGKKVMQQKSIQDWIKGSDWAQRALQYKSVNK